MPNWMDDDVDSSIPFTLDEMAQIYSTASVDPALLSYVTSPTLDMSIRQSSIPYSPTYYPTPQLTDNILIPPYNSVIVNGGIVPSQGLVNPMGQSTLHRLEPQTTLYSYLTTQNPRIRGPMEDPNLRRKNAKSPEFAFIWWDVRNVQVWDDFNLHTILAIPHLQTLLQCPLPVSCLPEAVFAPEYLQLGDKASFTKLANLSFCYKVTTALSMALGNLDLSMVLGPTGGSCELVGLYQDSVYQVQQNRVPGFIKSCREWNSLMQAGADGRRREYLQVLSQLQRYMRDHNTRYGYILTEQELVCVRAVTDQQGRPIFGCLDVSLPITWNQHGPGRFTIYLALWYLHMLANQTPLPGQFGWALNVPRSPSFGARQWTLPKDAWIPIPTKDDLAVAQSIRGWSEATDPLTFNETIL